MALIPAERLVPWVPGMTVGVQGGIDQYLPGGANERTTLIDVTQAPYHAAGVSSETTGSITSGTDQLVVASAAGWSVGNHIRVYRREIQQLEFTSDSTATRGMYFRLYDEENGAYDVGIAVEDEETALSVATRIREYDLTQGNWVVGGSGVIVTFTQVNATAGMSTVTLINNPGDGSPPPMTATGSVIQTALSSVTSSTTVEAIDGTTFTLSANASATVTDAQVSHDDTPAILAARDACGAGEVVYVPTGTYRVDSVIHLNAAFNGKTLRGDGSGLTILESHTDTAIGSVGDNETTPPIPPITVVSGATKGSTELELSSAPPWTGKFVYLQMETNDSIPVVSVYNYGVGTNQAPETQLVKIVSMDGTTATIDPPLYADQTGLEVRLILMTSVVEEIGVEGISIDATHYTGGRGAFINCGMTAAYNCWFKDVKSTKALNYGMGLNNSLYCTIRSSYAGDLKGSGSNGAGLLMFAFGCLVEDSIFVNAFPNIECNGGSGNAFCYNFGNAQANTNHNPHGRFNVHEGNAWNFMISDGYFGGESEQTDFGNFFWADAVYGTVNMRRFSRNFTIINNVHGADELGDHGYPNIGNTDSTGTAQLSEGDPWRDYKMEVEVITRTDGSNITADVTPPGGILWYAVGGDPVHVVYLHWGDDLEFQARCVVTAWSYPTVTLFKESGDDFPIVGTTCTAGPGAFYDNPGGSGSYQELDLDVADTTIAKSNYYLGSETYIEGDLGADTIPDGIVYTSAPSWWPGSMPWPPYNATSPESASVENIPAGYRYINGNNPPDPGSGSLTCETINVTTLTLG